MSETHSGERDRFRQRYVETLVECAGTYRAQTPFPLGDQKLLTETEERVLAAYAPGQLLTGDEIAVINSSFGGLDDYGLLILACRLALYGVRSQAPDALRAGLYGVLCGERGKSADCRDVWTALSIVNDCCLRLALTLDDELRGKLLAASTLRRQLIESWLLCDRDLRRYALFPVGAGETLTYYHFNNLIVI